MIRMIVVMVLIGFGGAYPLSAETASVQSGEHATFSRLVFPDKPGRTWRQERPTPSRVEIIFSEGAPDLDLARVFDFIPRDRLREAVFTTGKLILTLGCDCPVDISQIASGHIVVDVGDGPPLPAGDRRLEANRAVLPAKPRQRLLPLVLPPRNLKGPTFSEPMGPTVADEQITVADTSGPPQIQFHPLGNVPLTLIDPISKGDTQSAQACPIEALAAETLHQDPAEALQSLGAQIGLLLDGGDVLDRSAVIRLSHIYLAIGWGAEALQIASTNSTDQTALSTIAAALDGIPNPGGPVPDPGCGPATAVIALLSLEGPSDWDRTDLPAVTGFLDGMSTDRWRDLRDRLEAALGEVNSSQVLAGLGPAQDDTVDATTPSVRAAGTDIAAIEATIEILARALTKGIAAPDLQIGNALALRPSIPDGPLRGQLDVLLAETFVVARRPGEAVAMVANGNASAPDILDLALRHLSPSQAAEFVVRLRPHLTAFPIARQKAQAMFANLDLPEIARRFADDDPPTQDFVPTEAILPLADVDPWLSRNMAMLAAAPAETWTDRNRLAQAIVSRNASDLPPADLAAAEAVLSESRILSDLVSRLVRSP